MFPQKTLVKLENSIRTFPLAGTHFQGTSETEDKKLEEQLLADEKELAEHNMLVDLGRNDLGKVSQFGNGSRWNSFRCPVHSFAHVIHIQLSVRGEIDPRYDALESREHICAEASPARRRSSLQLINQLEQNKRGIYGGAIGYIDFAGNMDTCIAIRIAYKKNRQVSEKRRRGSLPTLFLKKSMRNAINPFPESP